MRGPFIKRNGLWLPQQVPSGPVAVDWSHSLSAGLLDLVLFANQQNCVNGDASPVNNGATAVAYPRGAAMLAAGGVTSYISLPSATPIISGGAYLSQTVAMLWRPTSLPGTFNAIIDKGTGAGREFSLFINSSGVSDDFNNGAYGSLNMPIGADYLLAASLGSSTQFYLGGASIALSSNAPNLSTNPAWAFGFNASGGGSNPSAAYYGFWRWNRTLSAAEHAWLAAEPFAMLRPIVRRQYYVAAVAGGITGTEAATTAAPTAAATGRLDETGSEQTTVAAPTAQGAGRLDESGSEQATVAAPGAHATGTLDESGSEAATVAAPTAAATGVVGSGISGTEQATVAAPGAQGAGRLDESGAEQTTVAAPGAQVTGRLDESGAEHATAAAPGAQGTGRLDESGSEQTTVAAPVAQATGRLDETGAASATAPAPGAHATGTLGGFHLTADPAFTLSARRRVLVGAVRSRTLGGRARARNLILSAKAA